MVTVITIGVTKIRITLVDLKTLNVTFITKQFFFVKAIIIAVTFLIRVEFHLEG